MYTALVIGSDQFRIQASQGLGARFREAGTEEEGWAYLAGARVRRRDRKWRAGHLAQGGGGGRPVVATRDADGALERHGTRENHENERASESMRGERQGRTGGQEGKAAKVDAFMNGAQRYSAQCTFYKQPFSPRMEDGVFIKLVLSLDAKQKIQI